MSKLLNRYSLIILALLLITPIGIFSKVYAGIGQEWVRNYSGDVLYEIFWCLVAFWFVRPAKNLSQLRQVTKRIAWIVLIVTSAIEVNQLWFHLVPTAIRSAFIWRMLLGAGFDWWDFPHYALGSLLGWWAIEQIGRFDRNFKQDIDL